MSDRRVPYALVRNFRTLFRGLDDAYGTGKGRWVRERVSLTDFAHHLAGLGPGLGIGPLMPDNNVWFAAIDLDEPNFELAWEMRDLIPGEAWIEQTRSGNAHVWCFFAEPLEAWVAMGLLKEICAAAGRKHTEVFPKNHNFAKVDLGNYINLPFYGDSRPILAPIEGQYPLWHYDAQEFAERALASRTDPALWRKNAAMMMIQDPAERDARSEASFGTQPTLHMCAAYIIEHCEDNPLVYGHQSNTMFLLAKQLSNWSECDHDEALAHMLDVNSHAKPGLPESEVRRILRNAEEKRYTSTGCDDPVVAPYVHPDCPIAHGG